MTDAAEAARPASSVHQALGRARDLVRAAQGSPVLAVQNLASIEAAIIEAAESIGVLDGRTGASRIFVAPNVGAIPNTGVITGPFEFKVNRVGHIFAIHGCVPPTDSDANRASMEVGLAYKGGDTSLIADGQAPTTVPYATLWTRWSTWYPVDIDLTAVDTVLNLFFRVNAAAGAPLTPSFAISMVPTVLRSTRDV